MKYDLYLRGYVGGADFDADLVSRTLAKHKDQPVTVLIDSLGGSLATALSIASAFRDHGDVTAHFVGMNASAATIASMGAKNITMDSSAMYLVHKCSAEFFQWASLNADQLQEQIDMLAQMKTDLEKMDCNVAQMYARKCKKPVADLLALMKTGGWLTAAETLQWGFVDSLTEQTEDAAPVLTEQVAASMQANGIPLPTGMEIQATPTPSGFAKLVDMLSAFFQRKAEPVANTVNPKLSNDMNKLLPFLAVALAVQQQQFMLKDEQLTLSAEQADALEAHLKKLTEKVTALEAETKSKDERITALEKQIAEQPADETHQVINANRAQEEQSPIAEYMQNLANARALYDSLP